MLYEIFTETLEQNMRKSHKICFFLDGKNTNKSKLEFLKFLRKSAELQGYRVWWNWRKLWLTCKFNKNALIRVFLHAEFISAMKTVQNPMVFMKNAKRIEKWVILIIFVIRDFHWNSWAECEKML